MVSEAAGVKPRKLCAIGNSYPRFPNLLFVDGPRWPVLWLRVMTLPTGFNRVANGRFSGGIRETPDAR